MASCAPPNNLGDPVGCLEPVQRRPVTDESALMVWLTVIIIIHAVGVVGIVYWWSGRHRRTERRLLRDKLAFWHTGRGR